jgi:sugar phosphate isomerase/epimerase
MPSGSHRYPLLHNATWPGIVGKGPDSEPPISLDTMLDLTAAAEVNGTRFDGVDLFLADPHFSIDSTKDDIKRLADKLASRGLVAGSVVAPVWPATGGGPAMGDADERRRFIAQVRKACAIAQSLRELKVRHYGVVRIDSAASCADWLRDPQENTARIAQTFREACDVVEDYGERLAAEGEICWGGMHSWRKMAQLLETVARPRTLGFQADMAHTLLYALGYNAPEDRILPADFDWSDGDVLRSALLQLTDALRPWTIDLHIAQNDASVKGLGTHDKTGHHCLPFDPAGKLDLVRDSGYWLRDRAGNLTKPVQHICWDGCMFPNAVMMNASTWQDVLLVMIAVREAHGWDDAEAQAAI